jgi:hypothetical protein
MNYIKKFGSFIAESRAFAEKSSEVHVGQGQKAPRYQSKDDFSRDCSDLLSDLYRQDVDREEWSEKLQLFNQHWDLNLDNPWTSDEDIKSFVSGLEAQDDGTTEWTPDEFSEMWDSAISGRVMEATPNVGDKPKSLQFSDLTVGDDVMYDNRPYKVSSVGDDHCFIKSGSISKRVAKIQSLKGVKIRSLNEATPNVGEKDSKDKTAKKKLREKIKELEASLKKLPKNAGEEKKRLKKKILNLKGDMVSLNEDTPNIGSKPKDPVDGSNDIDLNWDKMDHESRIEKLLGVVKDPDEAERLAKLSWSALPDGVSANLSTMVKSFEQFLNEARGREAANVLGEVNGVIIVDFAFRPIIMFKKDFAKHQSEEFKNANLSQGFFTGTAIVGKGPARSEFVNYSSPFHKGQVIEEPDEREEEEEQEEFDFKFDEHISRTVIEKLTALYCKKTYEKGYTIKKLILH